jgi:hypothetical protein
LAGSIEQNPAIFLPLFLAALWLTVTTILALLSGWFRLMEQYPDQPVEPILRLRFQSGAMGWGVNMNGILTLSVCPDGLRVGMMRVFGPFCRSFLVPWESIAIVRKTALFGPVAKLQFGNPAIGTLRIPSHVANRLARAANERWPEAGPFPNEKLRARFSRLMAQWAIATLLGALFFIIVPLAVSPSGNRPPILVAILLPAVVFGLASAARFFLEEG